MKIVIFSFLLIAQAWAVKLTDYKPYKYEVLFTNPECAEYAYDNPVTANDGSLLYIKPKNVYCKPGDMAKSASRSQSPQFRLLEWINDAQTKHIFMAYLSFSNKDITAALCSALKRGVELDLVLDNKPGEDLNSAAEGLRNCGPVRVHYRGNRGGLGFAHNKLTMINPYDKKVVKLVFSSANMSTGTAIHHENWNFVTTNPQSYFVQTHLCLASGMIDHAETRKQFVAYMNECRAQITSPEEDDIQTYFVPGDGKKAFNALSSLAKSSARVDAVAHRFSGIFINLFSDLLAEKKETRLVLDDDMYWSMKLRRDTGRNSVMEALKVKDLIEAGLNVKYMETNHNSFLLQHNKFMFFERGNTDVVFTGAGNFTTSAFDKNFENFYIIKDQEVAKAFESQFEKFWEEMATPYELLPTKNIMP